MVLKARLCIDCAQPQYSSLQRVQRLWRHFMQVGTTLRTYGPSWHRHCSIVSILNVAVHLKPVCTQYHFVGLRRGHSQAFSTPEIGNCSSRFEAESSPKRSTFRQHRYTTSSDRLTLLSADCLRLIRFEMRYAQKSMHCN